ncbi:MAG: hypothetical protein L6Q99_01485 [Planctomycetes bacterium]|nr:hypothetical protein [Planctomycetota bacterium]
MAVSRSSTRLHVLLVALGLVTTVGIALPGAVGGGSPATKSGGWIVKQWVQKLAPAKPVRSLMDTVTGDLGPDGLGLQVPPIGLGAKYQAAGVQAVVTGMGKIAAPPAWGGPRYLRYYEVTINPGTGYVETFIVQRPNVAPTTPAPLLMAFHKYGVSQKDITANTGFAWECLKRGWYMIAPLSAAQIHFSSIESQANTQAVFQWVLANFAIDSTRIYGAGFSMGAGAALNFAARHVDPAGPMFAAVVDHTGTVDLNDAYLNDPGLHVWPYPLDYWFGTNWQPGSADPWRMARSSVLSFDDQTLAVDPERSLATNLSHVALKLVRADNDPLAYLSRQTDVLDNHLRTNLGFVPGPRYAYDVVTGTAHVWTTLHFKNACDWLAQHTLTLPTQATTIADHDGVYFRFQVEQDAPNAFTPFQWNIDAANNALSLVETKNLKRVTLDVASVGLNPAAALSVTLKSADGLPDEVKLLGWPTPPTAVDRDGSPETSWSHDAQTSTLTIVEYDSAQHAWTLVP